MSLTKQDKIDIENIVDAKVNKAVNELAEIISDFATNVDKRFNTLERDVTLIQRDIKSILNRLDSIEGDIQLNEDERAVMGMQLNRIHDWIEKTAAKIGVEFIH